MTSNVKLTKAQYEEYVPLVSDYMNTEFDVKLGNMEAQFFLDQMAKILGPHFYNEGVRDSIAKLHQLTEFIEEELDLLIKI